MDFTLSDDQNMLVDTVTNFTKKESPVDRVRKIRATDIGWDRKVWRHMGELGWLGVALPENVGGIGGSFLDAGLIIERLGTTLVPEPYIPSVMVAGLTIARHGSEEQRQTYLPSMIEGKTSLALAYVEKDNRYDVADVTTRAEKVGGDYKLSGKKEWVLNGQAADHILVSARTSGGQREREGRLPFRRRSRCTGREDKNRGLHGQPQGGLHRVRWRQGRQGGTRRSREGKAASVLERAIDYGAAAVCAEGSGIVQSTLAMTREYMCQREQFGVKIGSFQALQHRLADVFVQVELCKGTAILALIRADSDVEVERKRSVSTAKKQLSKGGFFVTRQGIQLHGGIGVTDEHDVGLFFKRMQVIAALYGDEEHHVERFATLPSFTAGL